MRFSRIRKESRRYAYIKHNILSYKYKKRNILVATSVVCVCALIGIVVKYGEAVDNSSMNQVTAYSAQADSSYADDTIEDAYVSSTEAARNNTYSGYSVDINEAEFAMTEGLDMSSSTGSEFDGKFIVDSDQVLNVRKEASKDSEIVGKMYDGAAGEILSSDGIWTQIKSGDVTGYVMTTYILTGDKAAAYAKDYGKLVGTVNYETVKVRADKSADSAALGLVAGGTVLSVIEDDDQWVKVVTDEAIEGYISADYIDVTCQYETALTLDQYAAVKDTRDNTVTAKKDDSGDGVVTVAQQ